MKSAAVIAFDHRPSRLLIAAIAVVMSLAIAAVMLSGAVLWIKIALVPAAVLYAAFALRQLLHAPQRLAWHDAGHWRIVCGDGEHTAELSGATVRGAWIVLNLRRSDGVRIAVVLAPDNCDDETRRRIRVRLARADAQS